MWRDWAYFGSFSPVVDCIVFKLLYGFRRPSSRAGRTHVSRVSRIAIVPNDVYIFHWSIICCSNICFIKSKLLFYFSMVPDRYQTYYHKQDWNNTCHNETNLYSLWICWYLRWNWCRWCYCCWWCCGSCWGSCFCFCSRSCGHYRIASVIEHGQIDLAIRIVTKFGNLVILKGIISICASPVSMNNMSRWYQTIFWIIFFLDWIQYRILTVALASYFVINHPRISIVFAIFIAR